MRPSAPHSHPHRESLGNQPVSAIPRSSNKVPSRRIAFVATGHALCHECPPWAPADRRIFDQKKSTTMVKTGYPCRLRQLAPQGIFERPQHRVCQGGRGVRSWPVMIEGNHPRLIAVSGCSKQAETSRFESILPDSTRSSCYKLHNKILCIILQHDMMR